MASLYKKRGCYHVAYFVNGKRKHLNTKLKDTKKKRSKANKMKADIEREIESIAKSTEMKFVNLVSADRNITLKEAEEICLKERFLGKSQSHQDTFRNAMNHLYVAVPQDTPIAEVGTSRIADFIHQLSGKVANASVHSVMTWAMLDALGQADANGNATIEVTELAGWLDAKVPEISSAAFGFRQVPQMSIRGSDFALGATVAVLGEAPESFPATLSHVVAGRTAVLDAPGGGRWCRKSLPVCSLACSRPMKQMALPALPRMARHWAGCRWRR